MLQQPAVPPFHPLLGGWPGIPAAVPGLLPPRQGSMHELNKQVRPSFSVQISLISSGGIPVPATLLPEQQSEVDPVQELEQIQEVQQVEHLHQADQDPPQPQGALPHKLQLTGINSQKG